MNRELKHRRFWATDGNRKSNVFFFGVVLGEKQLPVDARGLKTSVLTVQT